LTLLTHQRDLASQSKLAKTDIMQLVLLTFELNHNCCYVSEK